MLLKDVKNIKEVVLTGNDLSLEDWWLSAATTPRSRSILTLLTASRLPVPYR